MVESRANITNKRHAWLAIVFSLVMPGLGQVYCGKLARGLVFTFLNLLVLPIMIALLSLSTSPELAKIALVLILAAGIVKLAAIIDSVYLARRTKTDYELKDYNRWYVYVLLVFIVTGGTIGSGLYLRDRGLEAFIVPEISMYPTIFPGDRLLANKTTYDTRDPKRGDVVVFFDLENRRQNYVKRVVALAGDTVAIKNGELYINGKKLKREKISDSPLCTLKPNMQGDIFYEFNGQTKYKVIMVSTEKPEDGDLAEITVPKYNCFVLGDNRNYSKDSRAFGAIPIASIKGRFDYLYCPAERWSRFGKIE